MLYIITGQTAVGKTGFALDFAETRGAEIVSCDASLVYRGMDIGTAKPTPEERARVRHHLIDIRDVDEPYDIVAFDRDARAAVADITARGRPVVVTGGSGFYLKSFLAPVVDSVVVPEAVRERVERLYADGGLEALLEVLRRCSPEGFGTLDERNPRRVLRALERCLASGKSLPELQAEFAARPEPYAEMEKQLILLERPVDVMRRRIVLRVRQMLEAGLVDEVRSLLQAGIRNNPSAAAAIGYRETLAFLGGGIDRAALEEAIVRNTLQLAKKQRTWFRTQIREPDERIGLGGDPA